VKMLLTRRVLVATLASAPAARRSTEHTCKVIDSAVHVWSNGQPPYPWAVAPPEELTATATYEALTASTQAAGVAGALIVQPANHMFDHSYVTAALRAHPDLYRGMLLANPTLAPAAAAAELERLHADGFVGVRFNPYLFPDGMDSPVGHALYKKAGELQMPVGVMCFKGLLPQLPALTALLDASPETTLIVDHLGFFRQPATGGLQGGGAANDEAAWKALLALAARPQACKPTPSPYPNPNWRLLPLVGALACVSTSYPPCRCTSRCRRSSAPPPSRLRTRTCNRACGSSSRATALGGSCGVRTFHLCCWAGRSAMATRSTTRRRASCLVSGRSLGSTSRRESSSWAAQRRGSSASEVLIRVAG